MNGNKHKNGVQADKPSFASASGWHLSLSSRRPADTGHDEPACFPIPRKGMNNTEESLPRPVAYCRKPGLGRIA